MDTMPQHNRLGTTFYICLMDYMLDFLRFWDGVTCLLRYIYPQSIDWVPFWVIFSLRFLLLLLRSIYIAFLYIYMDS